MNLFTKRNGLKKLKIKQMYGYQRENMGRNDKLGIWDWHIHTAAAAAAAKLLQSCPTLCNPIDSSPPASPVPGILQARILEWVAISFSNTWKWEVKVKSLSRVQLFETPWTACSPPGSSIHGIFQARVLEWGAIAFSVWMSSWSQAIYWVDFFLC